jgi:drug/metabolite transporter (DMT)-like permease
MAAACVHAAWNIIVARARDPEAATALGAVAGSIVLAPFAIATWDVRGAAVPYIVASATLHVAYFWFLAGGYAAGELSSVYPLARGTAPVLVLIVSVVFLGAHVSGVAAVGVIAVAAGVVAIRGIRRRAAAGGVAMALACGVTIAAYTLVDKEGLKHAAAVPYLGAMIPAPALVYLALVTRNRGRAAVRAAVGPLSVLVGCGMVGAYALALGALSHGPAAPVSAVRETSVLIATAFAAIVLREGAGRVRLAAAVAITAGIAAIALG